ncbi:hypothetical protein J2S40_001521 [Nocardioides luteus]|nr:hypothetical protein [Nocardioides luteus]
MHYRRARPTCAIVRCTGGRARRDPRPRRSSLSRPASPEVELVETRVRADIGQRLCFSFRRSPPTRSLSVSRSRAASRTGFARRYAAASRSLTRPPIEKRFRQYRGGGEGCGAGSGDLEEPAVKRAGPLTPAGRAAGAARRRRVETNTVVRRSLSPRLNPSGRHRRSSPWRPPIQSIRPVVRTSQGRPSRKGVSTSSTTGADGECLPLAAAGRPAGAAGRRSVETGHGCSPVAVVTAEVSVSSSLVELVETTLCGRSGNNRTAPVAFKEGLDRLDHRGRQQAP